MSAPCERSSHYKGQTLCDCIKGRGVAKKGSKGTYHSNGTHKAELLGLWDHTQDEGRHSFDLEVRSNGVREV